MNETAQRVATAKCLGRTWKDVAIVAQICVPMLLSLAAPRPLRAQDEIAPQTDNQTGQPPATRPSGTAAILGEQIAELSSPSYRTRELARWRLEQSPNECIVQIEKTIQGMDHNAAAQLIDLLSAFAMHSDIQVSLRAKQVLGGLSDSSSSIGRLAGNTLNAIADLQEEKAIEILRFHGAQIDFNLFPINGQAIPDSRLLGLKIDERFEGGDEIIQWIRFLKSVEAVYLVGPQIDSRYYAAIAGLSKLKAIKLKHVALAIEDLQLFKDLMLLEHLGLNYVDVDDNYIATILELPISRSLRLYGTKITPEGEIELNKQLDGLEIYRGNGGFLGVGTANGTTLVTSVVPGSGADAAGVRVNDRLTHVNDVSIANFDDLRKELGKHTVGDSIVLRVKRMSIEFVVTATLGEDQN